MAQKLKDTATATVAKTKKPTVKIKKEVVQEKIERRGGEREGSGRKQLPDSAKKIPVLTYIRSEEIDNCGDKKVLQKLFTTYFDKYFYPQVKKCKDEKALMRLFAKELQRLTQ